MQAEYNENLVKNLPDTYKKTTDSNNFKILEVERVACNDLRKCLWGYDKCKVCGSEIITKEIQDEQNPICPFCGGKVERIIGISDILNVSNAKGKTLDLYGERVGQARGLATDSKYLVMIKAKIMRNISNGSYESVVKAICETFECEPSAIYFMDDEKTCTVTLAALPLDTIVKAGLTTSQAVAIIKSLLPTGVTLNSFLFDGTFEFSNSESEYDEGKGFCDVEGGTIGGYLGVAPSDLTDEILPIY